MRPTHKLHAKINGQCANMVHESVKLKLSYTVVGCCLNYIVDTVGCYTIPSSSLLIYKKCA